MKVLALKEVLPLINGTVVTGPEEFEIKDVNTNAKGLRNGTMYFNVKKKSVTDETFNRYRKSIVIVTDEKVEMSLLQDNITVVIVKDIKEALDNFLAYYRGLFNLPVIGITGTAGKTTTKEMLVHILREDRNVQATLMSMNGLTLNKKYLLGIDDETDVAVFEMGVSYPGNVRKSGIVFKPTIGAITNIGIAHLETCRTHERYIDAKAEMLEALNYQGTLLLNKDDENIKKIDLRSYQGKVIYFGQDKECDYHASEIQYETEGMAFYLWVRNNNVREKVCVPGFGEHTVYNALAAIAAAHEVGVSIEKCIDRIGSFEQVERHVSIKQGWNNATIIDDTWNSNPSSANAALRVLKELAKKGNSIAVFGKLQRLGNHETEEHNKLGKKIQALGIDLLITVGKEAENIGEFAKQAGMNGTAVFSVDSAEKLNEQLSILADETSVVLLKMSLDKTDDTYRKLLKSII